ncbi:tyrosine-type recombinase/integrase [Paenibacillus sp. OAS669]|uniref:tyrosine-type recombinase/integrase n=1 Tax=Paenibacillus sp. OAS669 TaxID=2663821 RepID=UPI00178BF90B|nr:tyrosine-type recombinase/integrase [Paenibacillus sp. OAS669]MBE1443911.1 integrase/recombinase XerD [Paenibacillus sp. OAS669]
MERNDKRAGRKQVMGRQPVEYVELPSYTLEEAVEFVVKVKRAKNLKERTIDGYIDNMRYFIEWVSEHYGELSIQDVTTAIIREYVLWCAEEKEYYSGHPYKSEYDKDRRGLSPASVNVRIRVLRTFFSVLHDEEIIDRNPAQNVSLMRQDVDTVQPLTEDELRRFLKAPNQRQWAQWRDYCIIITILDTGARLNEICSLEKAEIDFVKKQITLPAIKNKNRRSRVLPLSTETARLLRQLIVESEKHFESTYVFTTNYGEQLSEKTVQKAFDKYAEKAKLGRSVSPHVLRHNFASMAAENGMSVFHLQKIMGHAEIATTRKYVQLSEESIADQHKRFSPLSRVMKRK